MVGRLQGKFFFVGGVLVFPQKKKEGENTTPTNQPIHLSINQTKQVRFGLLHVDYDTQKRTPKESAKVSRCDSHIRVGPRRAASTFVTPCRGLLSALAAGPFLDSHKLHHHFHRWQTTGVQAAHPEVRGRGQGQEEGVTGVWRNPHVESIWA